MTHWFISFATDDGFLGATVVAAEDDAGALEEATRRGLNPGGEAVIIQVPPEADGGADMTRLLNRLADKEEMLAHGGKRIGDMSDDERARLDASFVCDKCND
mgnify:CR=1 FL=1